MLIDAHTHIDEYNPNNLQLALQDIEQNKILSIANSMDINSYIKVKEISKMSSYIIPTFGIHPWKAKGYEKKLEKLLPYINETPMIGEIGLDFFWVSDKESFKSQVEVFEFFLREAKKSNKVINIHTKGAEREVLKLLDKDSMHRVIIHWYSGPKDILLKMIDRGYYFTVGVEIMHSSVIREIASMIPLERILTETDNPGGEEWLSHNIGMPSILKKVITVLTNIKQVDCYSLEKQIESNFNYLTHLSLK